MKILNYALICSLILSGCSTANVRTTISTVPDDNYSYVDLSRVDKEQYKKDYAECAELANQQTPDNSRIAGNTFNKLLDRASFGILGSSVSKDADSVTVLKRCLEGRGYHVLR